MTEKTSDWFDRLYEEHAPKMKLLARKSLDSTQAAEDLVQEVFVLLLLHEHKVRTYKNPQGWLYLTLRNQIGNYLQRMRYRKTLPLDDHHGLTAEESPGFSLADSLPKGLSQKDRDILIQFYDQEKTYEELANSLGCTVLTCRTRLCRARAHFKELYLEEKRRNL